MNKLPNFEKNIKEFMEEHGIEGFLKLYFATYLMQLLKSEIKSKGGELGEDPGYIFYIRGKEIERLSDIEKYEDQLYEEFKKKADEMIVQLKKDKKFKDFFEGNFGRFKDPEMEKRFEKRLHETIESWKRGK